MLDMLVYANAMAENYYADGKGDGHPSIRKFREARDDYIQWRIKATINDMNDSIIGPDSINEPQTDTT